MAGRPFISAHDLARMLDARAEAVARAVRPDGQLVSNEWVSASITGSSPRGLSIRVRGSKSGVWAEFDGTARGDTLAYVAHVLYAGDMKAAYRWGLDFLGIAAGAPAPRPQAPPRAAAEDSREHERATRAAALRLFLSGQTHLAGTPAYLYLRDDRGIDLAERGRQPGAFRFHPACYCAEAGTHLPALLAAVTGIDGQHVSTHRTYLAQRSGIWMKAPLKSPKMSYGKLDGGTIRLWRGASGKPLAQAPETDTIVISEGIENGLSCAIACPEYRVLAAVNLSNLGRVALPPHALDIIIAADNDAGNPGAQANLRRAVDRLLAEGRSVRVAYSSFGKDMNDALRSDRGRAA